MNKKILISIVLNIIILFLFSLSIYFIIFKSNLPDKALNFLISNNIIDHNFNQIAVKIINSNYYTFELTKVYPEFHEKNLFSKFINTSTFKYQKLSRYGGLELINNSILYVDGDGLSLIIKKAGEGPVIQGPLFNIPNNKQEFLNFFEEKYLTDYFGIKDVLVLKISNYFSDIYISTTTFNIDEKCYSLSVFKNTIDINYQLSTKKWLKVYETNPCLIKHKGGIFLGQSAGGRLASNSNGDVYLSTGDFYFDGVNEKNILASKESDYGKILLIPKTGLSATIVAKGLRNPQGLLYYKGLLYETEHGPQGGDEVNTINTNIAVFDYGWPNATFGVDYGKTIWPLDPENSNHLLKNFSLPLYSWIPSIGVSNLLAIKKSSKIKRWDGNLVIASLRDQSLYRIALDKNRVHLVERINVGFRIRDLIQLGDDIYLLEDSLSEVAIWKLSVKENTTN